MMKKMLLAAVTLIASAAASFATDYARIDINFHCRGNLKCLSPKKAGIQIVPRRDYSDSRHADKCYYSITVNLDVTQEVDVVYEVVDTGGKATAKVIPSIFPIRLPKGTGPADVECLEFEIGDETSPLVPCRVTKWTSMLGGPGIEVVAGDKFAVKVKFRKPAK